MMPIPDKKPLVSPDNTGKLKIMKNIYIYAINLRSQTSTLYRQKIELFFELKIWSLKINERLKIFSERRSAKAWKQKRTGGF
jgi:hypothetical protein